MPEVTELKEEIQKLKARNKMVEINKAWETSLSRRLLLMILTYLVISITLVTLQNQSPWTNAIIPTLGFFLSTLTIPAAKNLWVKHLYKKQ